MSDKLIVNSSSIDQNDSDSDDSYLQYLSDEDNIEDNNNDIINNTASNNHTQFICKPLTNQLPDFHINYCVQHKHAAAHMLLIGVCELPDIYNDNNEFEYMITNSSTSQEYKFTGKRIPIIMIPTNPHGYMYTYSLIDEL
jgi:hypothetical protein